MESPAEIADRAYRGYLRLEPAAGCPKVVLVAGVPGTGKSTLAESLARHLRAPIFSMDWLLGVLVPFGVLTDENAVPLAELNLSAFLARHVQLGIDATGLGVRRAIAGVSSPDGLGASSSGRNASAPRKCCSANASSAGRAALPVGTQRFRGCMSGTDRCGECSPH
ncbi:AAA family ATPase [Lentzea sp. NPDC051213]|uniref:AAA family ATPase n=1 Tax=Lentzea sp. NPDC051213 TaxID=3364126 RepID=UPI003797124D